jgi:hypothetical protein
MPTCSAIRAAALGAALLALAACETGGGAARPIDRTSVDVAGQSVTVAAPSGFCIDTQSTRVSGGGAFVLVTDCQLLGFPTTRPEPVGAVLTASLSQGTAGPGAAPGDLSALGAFFATAEGRAVLGRSGDATRTRIISSRERNGVLYLLVEDQGPQPVPGIAPQFWRAFLTVRGRMAALSVLEFAGSGVASDQKLGYLQSFADAIQAANPEQAAARPAS